MNGDAPKVLSVPRVGAAHYSRNFIRQAVCEFRFPTIFEIEEQRPPAQFWKVIRKHFPIHEIQKGVSLAPGSMTQASAHQFRSRQGRWAIALRASAITLETAKYGSFDEFFEQLRIVEEAAQQTIDSEFYTRVGLRYINVLPYGQDDLGLWVNDALVGPLSKGVYGDATEHSQQVRGVTQCGGFTFQHSLLTDPNSDGKRSYVLDFDFYREEVEVTDALTTVKKLHELEFSMFSWALGDRAREYLNSPSGE